MERKIAFSAFVSMFLLSTIVQTQSITPVAAQATAQNYIDVPFHGQITGIYCGPACLEMVFDYYCEVQHPLSQVEIAEVARTYEHGGTVTVDMVRAAHFSNLSTSSGKAMHENITGYSTRQLGYAAFEQFNMRVEDLKILIDRGYPIIVLTRFAPGGEYGHYRLVVGYDPTSIVYHDPISGPNRTMTYAWFLDVWEYSSNWGLFVSPWNITLDAPAYVQQGSTFTLTADIAYPCPMPFSVSDYPASSCNATIILTPELNLAPGETAKKTLDTGDLSAGSSTAVSWTVQAGSPGAYTVSVTAEGKVVGYDSTGHSYEDRIGGSYNVTVRVNPTGPVFTHLVRRKAWPEHHHFALSRDGDPAVNDRHGTPGYQTLYGIVKNTGNIAIPNGMYRVVWAISDSTGSSVLIVETVGTLDLAPTEITVLTYDVPASDLPPNEYYVEAQCYYYWVAGEEVKTFRFIVTP